MSVTLKFADVEGLMLRQQSAHKVERTEDGASVISGTEWRFDKAPNGELLQCEQDMDLRRVDPEGRHIKLGTYTVYITAGLKNLVIEKRGAVAHVDFRNGSLRNQLKIRYQQRSSKKTEDGKVSYGKWTDNATTQYIPPNSWTGVSVGEEQRAIVDEMPT